MKEKRYMVEKPFTAFCYNAILSKKDETLLIERGRWVKVYKRRKIKGMGIITEIRSLKDNHILYTIYSTTPVSFFTEHFIKDDRYDPDEFFKEKVLNV